MYEQHIDSVQAANRAIIEKSKISTILREERPILNRFQSANTEQTTT
jgi:hypothetical protein